MIVSMDDLKQKSFANARRVSASSRTGNLWLAYAQSSVA